MAGTYNGVAIPADGKKIGYAAGKYEVPDNPIIPFIEGDGTGRDIWKASLRVFNAAVEKAYKGKRRVAWYEVFAGEKAKSKFDNWLPDDTVDAIREFRVAIKGPLTTPVGGGIRSLNVALRQILDLYCCVRPVKYYKGVPSPVKHPERMDVVIFRENTEDVYAGIEWEEGTPECAKLIEFLNKDMLKGGKKQVRLDSGVGVKPISVTGTKRLVRMAIKHALESGRKTVTLMHKGNFQMDWQYPAAADGNIALTGEVDFTAVPDLGDGAREFTVAIGFGDTAQSAATRTLQAIVTPWLEQRESFVAQWKRAAISPECDFSKWTGDGGALYRVSRNVLLAHEDKDFEGAMTASLSTPWGETKTDEDRGGYHLVWTRDLVQSASALLATGQTATPLRALIWLACIQDKDGSILVADDWAGAIYRISYKK